MIQMTDEIRNKLQQVQLELVMELDRICRKEEINYFLDSGTLLGAVRHKGFIPWDDDLDIGMMRSDYMKFLSVAPGELKEKYFLQTWDTDPYYGLPFAKIRKNDTLFLEGTAKNVKAHTGIYIDIFPYDNFGNSQLRQGIWLTLIRRMIAVKYGYQQWKEFSDALTRAGKTVIYLPVRFVSIFFSKDFLIQWYERIAMKYNGSITKDVFENSSANYGRWVIDREDVAALTELAFEGNFLKAPEGYDRYLKRIYGDYFQLPPVEKRGSRHNIADIRF